MVTECPKCQAAQIVDFLESKKNAEITCADCHSHLRVIIVTEILSSAEDLECDESPQEMIAPEVFQSETGQEEDENMADDVRPSREIADSKSTVLISIDGEATREVMREILENDDYTVLDIPSGISAFMAMKLNPPEAVLLDMGGADMPGLELCSKIKGSEELDETIVILVGSMFEKNTKYRSQASPQSEADAYIDRHQIPKTLSSKLERLLEVRREREQKLLAHQEEEAIGIPPESPAPEIEQEAPSSEQVEQAKRYAKMIVSDIAIFNEGKVEEGLREGNFNEVLAAEIEEGRQVFESRVDPSIYGLKIYEQTIEDFLEDKNGTKNPEDFGAEKATEIRRAEEDEVFGVDQDFDSEMSEEFFDPEKINEKSEHAFEKASVLAKSILSDLVSANEQKVKEGLDRGTFYGLLGDEIMAGRQVFELKAPAYFDSSIYEEAFEKFIEEKTGKANQTADLEIESSISRSAVPVSEDEEDSLGNSIAPDEENPSDLFKEMEEQAEAFAEDKSDLQPNESLLEDPVVSEAEKPNDLFKEMEEQAEALAKDGSNFQLEGSVLEDSLVPEIENPSDLFKEMEEQAEVLAKDVSHAPSEDSAFGDLISSAGDMPTESPQSLEGSLDEVPEEADGAESDLPAGKAEASEIDSKEIGAAKRLANIIVSDIVIYNEKKVAEGLEKDTFYSILGDEIEEGRVLFISRVSQEIFDLGIYEEALKIFIERRSSASNEVISQSEQATEVCQDIEPPENFFSTETVQTSTEPQASNGKGGEAEAETSEEKSAKRLAKIIVSDIVIYNEKKVEKGLQEERFYELLEDEIKEGHQLYESRVTKEILKTRDYMKEAFENFISKKAASLS